MDITERKEKFMKQMKSIQTHILVIHHLVRQSKKDLLYWFLLKKRKEQGPLKRPLLKRKPMQ